MIILYSTLIKVGSISNSSSFKNNLKAVKLYYFHQNNASINIYGNTFNRFNVREKKHQSVEKQQSAHQHTKKIFVYFCHRREE